ncbi:hypothetical protein FHR99_003143 [Litorivivens lipolytica]|uniref:DNA replication terminus site binding protein n=1 Tax=Litorivivens lipolytica TaxID=1524264 RepID=A0A7W4W8L7_9GAMM|nr:hypothetical protein [Litorivivens lipolytica]MBB3048869.1 hypothetical protein [Litorivivens lipolytica]
MDASLIPDILESAERLLALNSHFVALAQKDSLPVWLPEEVQIPPGKDDRSVAIEAIAPLWFDDNFVAPRSGILCASPETVAAARELNTAKEAFQSAVVAFRQSSGDLGTSKRRTADKTSISRLMGQILDTSASRSSDLSRVLQRMDLSRLNLVSAYRTVRILHPETKSVRWTWARRHSEVSSVTLEQARILANELSCRAARDTALRLLADLNAGEKLAYRKPIKPQLRANLTFTDQARKRQQIITPSVIIMDGCALPAIKWPGGADDSPARAKRSDICLSGKPYINSLSLYRYQN